MPGLAEVARATSRLWRKHHLTKELHPSLPFFGQKLVHYFPIGVGFEFIGVSHKTVQDGCRALDRFGVCSWRRITLPFPSPKIQRANSCSYADRRAPGRSRL